MFLIDSDYAVPERFRHLEKSELERLRLKIRNFIISHLDDDHHRLVASSQMDARETLKLLEQMGEPKNKHAAYVAKRKFIDLRYNKSEQSALDFFTDFEALVARIRRCGRGQEELDDEAVKHNLLTAIEASGPAVHLKEMKTEKGMSIVDIKALVLAEEEREKELNRREEESVAMVVQSGPSARTYKNNAKKSVTFSGVRGSNNSVTCFRCGCNGHTQLECTSKDWVCYNCGERTNSYIAETCPKPNAAYGKKKRMNKRRNYKSPRRDSRATEPARGESKSTSKPSLRRRKL